MNGKWKVRGESVRFVLPAMSALGLLGGCSQGGGTNPALDDLSPGGKGALHTRANDPSLPDGGDDGGNPGAAGALHLSGTLSGFWGPCEEITCGNTLVLENNFGDDLTLTDNGVFTFATPLSPGQGYEVTVLHQPPTLGPNGGQTCVVGAGTGNAGSQDVTNVVVHCTTNSRTIGGTASGVLAGARVLLTGAGNTTIPKGGERFVWEEGLSITGDGSPSQIFRFQTPLLASTYYSIWVSANPPAPLGQNCALTRAHGEVSDFDILDVNVTCTTLPYLYSFESGTEGWSNLGLGATTRTPDFHTQGLFGLKIIALEGDTWFGAAYDAPIDLGGKTHLKWDIETDVSPTTQELAIQTGDSWTWCQGGGWPWIEAGTTTTMDVDLTSLDCNADLSQVHALYIYFTNGGGGAGRSERIYYMDNVRAE
jgi:hypothetical protein